MYGEPLHISVETPGTLFLDGEKQPQFLDHLGTGEGHRRLQAEGVQVVTHPCQVQLRTDAHLVEDILHHGRVAESQRAHGED